MIALSFLISNVPNQLVIRNPKIFKFFLVFSWLSLCYMIFPGITITKFKLQFKLLYLCFEIKISFICCIKLRLNIVNLLWLFSLDIPAISFVMLLNVTNFVSKPLFEFTNFLFQSLYFLILMRSVMDLMVATSLIHIDGWGRSWHLFIFAKLISERLYFLPQ